MGAALLISTLCLSVEPRLSTLPEDRLVCVLGFAQMVCSLGVSVRLSRHTEHETVTCSGATHILTMLKRVVTTLLLMGLAAPALEDGTSRADDGPTLA